MSDEDRINIYILSRATKRLNRELIIISKDPIPGIDLRANKDNILEWHFVIHGKEDSPYYGGMYHGKLIFPSNFPFDPPKIIFLTPNGRFKTNERICFSLSDFHPEEWKPNYSVSAVLQGICDFMHDSTETIGSIETDDGEKKQFAESSSIHNGKDSIFCRFFPHLGRRKVKHSEDSSGKSCPSKSLNTFTDIISPVREKTQDPKTQSSASTHITLPPTDLTPVPSGITSLPPPGETTKPKEILPPSHTTPSVTKTIPEPSVEHGRTRPSKRKRRTSQNVPKQQKSKKDFQTPSRATHSQRNPPFSPKEIIPQQTLSTEKEISSVVEKSPVGNNSIQKQSNNAPPPHTTTPSVNKTIHGRRKYGGIRRRFSKNKVGRETLHRQKVDTHPLRLHKFPLNIKRMNFTIGVLVVSLILILIICLLTIVLLFTITQINFNPDEQANIPNSS